MNKDHTTELSVVIPFFNEEACAASVLEEIIDVFSHQFSSFWEILMVNDGSSDATASIIDTFSQKHSQLRSIHLPCNCGQSAALQAGFHAAAANVLGMIDGDGQNDPRDFPKLIEAMQTQKVDMMCGIRENRSDTWIRRISSKVANKFRSTVLNDDIVDIGCSIRVFRRECLNRIIFFRTRRPLVRAQKKAQIASRSQKIIEKHKFSF